MYQRLFKWTDEATKYLTDNEFTLPTGHGTWVRRNTDGRYTLAYCTGYAFEWTEIHYIYHVRSVA